MSTVAAGTAGTTASCGRNNSDPVTFAEAFGNSPECIGTAAVFTFDRFISLAEASHGFKLMTAFFTDIFVDRHFSLLGLH